jgi:hypothetical protein
MWVPIVIVVGVALVFAALVDLRARRKGRRIRIDAGAAGDIRRLNEADLRMRSNHQDFGRGAGGSGFGF